MRFEGAAVACIRCKFTKREAVRFLSHLDLLKLFERALRRAELPVSYTEGFHPRLRISFGPALSLGTASTTEWVDMEMAQDLTPEELRSRLNATLPTGLEVLEARRVPLYGKSLQALIRRATYHVALQPAAEPQSAAERLMPRIHALLAQQEILVPKKNKTVNVRGLIEALEIIPGDAERGSAGQPDLLVEMTLGVGPDGSVRPEELLQVLLPEGFARVRSIERVALLEPRGTGWAEPWPDDAR